MGASKEYFCIMQEETFNNLPSELRMEFNNVEVRESNEYENNKGDTVYLSLKKKEREAKKAVQDYLYNKRHK